MSNSFAETLELCNVLENLPLNSMKIRLRNRCFVTGRPRGFYRDFGLSRNMLRYMGHECLLPGLTKASW
jgi:small subunit ribosomal protein S14